MAYTTSSANIRGVLQMPRIWLDYCAFLMKQPKITRTRRTFDKALRSLPLTQHERVWTLYLEFAKEVGGETANKLYKRYLKVRCQLLVNAAHRFEDVKLTNVHSSLIHRTLKLI
jgi:hypothetical protein